jgi:GTPase SAR1 family protein
MKNPTAFFRKLPTGGDDREREIGDKLAVLGHKALADEVTAYGVRGTDKVLRVTVFGEYSVGKSTLINALLGRQLLAAKLRPTTGVPAEIRYGADDVTIVFRDGTERKMTIEAADGYSNLGVENRARDEVERIIIAAPNAILKGGIALIDTPGILDDDKQTERSRLEVAGADVVLLVLRADHLLSQTECGFAINWLTEELGKPVVPIVNFMGLIDASGHKELRDLMSKFAPRLLHPFDRPWYEVDAMPALRHGLGQAGVPPPNDDFTMLATTLGNLTPGRIADVKRRSRERWRASWSARAKQENAANLARIETDGVHLGSERRAAVERMRATLDRIQRNFNGERVRCLAPVNLHKTGGRFAVANALPPVNSLKTELQRKAGAEAVGRAFEHALAAIDGAANQVLMGLALDADMMLEPISVRELVALNVPPADISAAASNSGLKWAAIIGLPLAPVLGLGAIPVAIAVWFFRRNSAETSKQVSEFRSKFADAIDAELDKVKTALADQFNARMREMIARAEGNIKTIETLPPASGELILRRELDALLG